MFVKSKTTCQRPTRNCKQGLTPGLPVLVIAPPSEHYQNNQSRCNVYQRASYQLPHHMPHRTRFGGRNTVHHQGILQQQQLSHYNKICKLCGKGEEDLVHFIAECGALEGKRDYNLLNWFIEDPRERMIELLFRQEDYQGVGRMIKELWFRRKNIIKYREKMEQERRNNKPTPDELCSSDPGPRRHQSHLRERSQRYSVDRG